MISEFPLLMFTVLTGIAAGMYIAAAIFPKQGDDGRPWILPAIALVLVAVGGLASMGHLARPELVLGVFNRPTSPLTMEGITAGLMALVAVVDFVIAKRDGSANRLVRLAGAVMGIIAICVVTSVYVTSYGCPTWTTAPTWLLFAASDLAVGFACWMAVRSEPDKRLGLTSGAICAVFAVVLAWQAVVFNGLNEPGALLIGVGAACSVAAAILAYLQAAGKSSALSSPWGVAIVMIVAVFVSRYGFYMASVI